MPSGSRNSVTFTHSVYALFKKVGRLQVPLVGADAVAAASIAALGRPLVDALLRGDDGGGPHAAPCSAVSDGVSGAEAVSSPSPSQLGSEAAGALAGRPLARALADARSEVERRLVANGMWRLSVGTCLAYLVPGGPSLLGFEVELEVVIAPACAWRALGNHIPDTLFAHVQT